MTKAELNKNLIFLKEPKRKTINMEININIKKVNSPNMVTKIEKNELQLKNPQNRKNCNRINLMVVTLMKSMIKKLEANKIPKNPQNRKFNKMMKMKRNIRAKC